MRGRDAHGEYLPSIHPHRSRAESFSIFTTFALPGFEHNPRSHQGVQSHLGIRVSLIDWARLVVGEMGMRPAAHHLLLLHQLNAVSRGEIDRLMVLMPPGSAKSTYVSVNTNLWGAYVSTPATPGTWYAWAEGTDGSLPTVYPTPFTVT